MGFLEWAGGVAEDVGGAVVDGATAVGNAVAEGAGQVYDTGADLFGYNSRAQNAQGAAATASEEYNEKLRQQLEAQNSAMGSGLEFDPASITQQENWQSYSHQDLYDTNQRSLDQGKATEAAQQWREVAAELKDIGPELQSEAGSAIAGGWEGDAADAANESSEPLVNWISGSSEAFHLTGNKIEEAASAAGQVKAMVPEPEGHHYGRTMLASIPTGVVGGGVDALAQMRERQQAERGAQETMGRVLSPTYSNVDTSVPAYRDLNNKPPPPPPPPIEPPPPPVRPRDRRGSGQPSTPSVANVGDIIGGDPNIPAETRSAWTPGDSPARLSGDLTGIRTAGFPGRTGNGDVGVGYLPGPGAGRTGPGGPGGGPGRGGPGGGSGMGRGGAGGAGGGKPGGLGAGGAGRPGAGALGAGGRAGVGGLGAAGGAGTGAAGSAAGRGGAGAGGMGAAGQRGQGSEDQDHERPGWLEEQDDIWLEDMPKTAPPVFGA
ncbi:PPE domain-containing protein [Saccharopolyspora hattusasensis]|uniref:PPE domain-containing protein n=1 Tax=Saccharopolyspora hattusasensis TaxID=1128679 RepID=UPI003D99C832